MIARADAAAFFSTGSPLYFPPTIDERTRAHLPASSLGFALEIISRRVAQAATSGGLLSAAASARGAAWPSFRDGA